jgi:hypothetical protein
MRLVTFTIDDREFTLNAAEYDRIADNLNHAVDTGRGAIRFVDDNGHHREIRIAPRHTMTVNH